MTYYGLTSKERLDVIVEGNKIACSLSVILPQRLPRYRSISVLTALKRDGFTQGQLY